ncbi:MAG: DUF2911 domain-containing protein [Bacteroidia bacterium]
MKRSSDALLKENSHEHSQNNYSGYADSVNTGLINPDTLKGSPRRKAMADVTGNHVHVDYGSPGVRGRMIWGGLVAFDEVWASGAHTATSITFDQPVSVGETIVKAGTYGFFTIPGKENWTLILNKNYQQHLADDYDKSEDILRLERQVDTLGYPVPRLTYEVIELGEGRGLVELSWEKIRVSLPFYNEEVGL